MILPVLGCLWVLAATATAFLPLRRQYLPGLALLVTAPVLIGAFAWHHGPWPALLAAFAFVSMFRRPLRHLAAKVPGRVSRRASGPQERGEP